MSDNPFQILDDQPSPPQLGEEIGETQGSDLQKKIQSLTNCADIVLFMKGNPQSPQCGFSANAVGILNQMGKPFKTFDILSDIDVRQGLKEYSNWPTYPQLYVKGELVGGNDILMEMHREGNLQKLFDTL
ncbi:MAG: Grx4 family monothiol glutaredoxin [Bacteriovoracales bacterium]|nr:Grx4 family monothiol glutaredoxin [Bacteriovoracales bacterium]